MSVVVPARLAKAVRRREGAAAEAWLRELPGLVEDACVRWDCQIAGSPLHGETALVLPVECAGQAAALKISFPHQHCAAEAAALKHFDGAGVVRLLEASADSNTLLLERVGPATLETVRVEEATEIAGELARRLAVPAPAGTRALSSTTGPWLAQLDQQAMPGLLPKREVDRARELIAFLADDRTGTMLHGDLHFGNVLRARREPWLAIDPIGWRGTAAFDAFTVVARRRRADDLTALITRFSRAAQTDPGLAARCCQARAVSAYLHQEHTGGAWFDRDVLLALISGTSPPRPRPR
ncbi:aminoglycoside phosphotransferase family protein [Amycolatopsis dendrobii]|uniref:Phosphotransferase n=1 Tax=Amycolatopsis dendrobii TaxID=2760662 RepID=A0A7W3VYC8_9PSEU|nr:aminoglycoside phosphotransferase family protein [Amycolatopsis dendrobii]MBB1155341.1 phosphotransferase [Amycolatopsis dendrobii]